MPVCVQPTTKTKSPQCSFANCESKKIKFGEIEQLHEEIFASKEFPIQLCIWSMVGRELTEKRTVMLLSNVSPPLTFAT